MPEASGRPRAAFQPRFTLGLFYIAAFFLLFALLLIAPELREVAGSSAPGEDQQRLAKEVARNAVRPRLPVALGLAVLATALGARFRLLPGLRPPA